MKAIKVISTITLSLMCFSIAVILGLIVIRALTDSISDDIFAISALSVILSLFAHGTMQGIQENKKTQHYEKSQSPPLDFGAKML